MNHFPDQLESDMLQEQEWLVTNGLGGYASGTVSGTVTRRYHGLLTAALPSPLGRVTMLNQLVESVILPDNSRIYFSGTECVHGKIETQHREHLKKFHLEDGLPVWQYEREGLMIEKRIILVHRQNTVHVTYRLLSGEPVRIYLRPAMHFHRHNSPVSRLGDDSYTLIASGSRYEIRDHPPLPSLRLRIHGRNPAFSVDPRIYRDIDYRIEKLRGYASDGEYWSPGEFSAELESGTDITLIASTENWEAIEVLTPHEIAAAEKGRRNRLLSALPAAVRNDGLLRQLVFAADQFIITPAGRKEETIRARIRGDGVRTIIAGYHWFTDWGRDVMISLEGLTLATGRHVETGYILRNFAHHVKNGLIPNFFPEGKNEGVYHTADATLWFFHALHRYVQITGDRYTLASLLPVLTEIVCHHLSGTRFGIGVDADDGLLRNGDATHPLTWMDAKTGTWIVTPRRGKAVEINALWYNALCLLANWLEEESDSRAGEMKEHAARAFSSFNHKFWNAKAGFLYDVVDGDQGHDPACRPNQLLAISLTHAILLERYWKPVFDTVRNRLLTPVGLRTLDPDHPDYKPSYFGNLIKRDAAYHQGTVWPWLFGPMIDAWAKVYPEEKKDARRLLEQFLQSHLLSHGCIGSINEIFDAQAPYFARGCVAQAWSVAEVFRALLVTRST